MRNFDLACVERKLFYIPQERQFWDIFYYVTSFSHGYFFCFELTDYGFPLLIVTVGKVHNYLWLLVFCHGLKNFFKVFRSVNYIIMVCRISVCSNHLLEVMMRKLILCALFLWSGWIEFLRYYIKFFLSSMLMSGRVPLSRLYAWNLH